MKITKRLSAAEIASNEMIAALTEEQVLSKLRTELHRARVWYRLHGRKFRLPVEAISRKTN